VNVHSQGIEIVEPKLLSTVDRVWTFLPSQASRCAIQSWSGSFWNRHFRIGPAITFK
jgi:hypothetical protein